MKKKTPMPLVIFRCKASGRVLERAAELAVVSTELEKDVSQKELVAVEEEGLFRPSISRRVLDEEATTTVADLTYRGLKRMNLILNAVREHQVHLSDVEHLLESTHPINQTSTRSRETDLCLLCATGDRRNRRAAETHQQRGGQGGPHVTNGPPFSQGFH